MTKTYTERKDGLFVRYCSHPDGHAPKDCPDRKPKPRIVAECYGCLSVTYKPIDPRPLTANEVKQHRAAGHDVREVKP